ncbi:MAG: isochorismatase family protein [Candidatus Glassbacteria bacterium]
MKEPYVTIRNIAQKTSQWKKLIEPYNTHVMELYPRASALLVIDMQNCFLEEGCSAWMDSTPAIVPNVKKLIEVYRRKGLPVIFTAHAHESGKLDGGMMSRWWGKLILKGTHDAELFTELKPLSDEKVIYKNRYSAFYNTDLETNLRCLGVADMVITGVMTNMCCESTARDAFFRDYRVFFLMDATAAVNEEFHLSTLRNLAYGFAYITETASILRVVSSL